MTFNNFTDIQEIVNTQIWVKNKPFVFSGTASSHDPTGSLTFCLSIVKSGWYSQRLPSLLTRSLQLNKFGMGKQSVTNSTCTLLCFLSAFLLLEPKRTASLAADNCKCSLTTSLDHVLDLSHGSLTAIRSNPNPCFLGGTGSGMVGQEGISVNSSSSIHSGYRVFHVMELGNGSSFIAEICEFGMLWDQYRVSVKLKFRRATFSGLVFEGDKIGSMIVKRSCHSIFWSDMYLGSIRGRSHIQPTSTNLALN